MVNNLLCRWPKPTFFHGLLGAHGISWVTYPHGIFTTNFHNRLSILQSHQVQLEGGYITNNIKSKTQSNSNFLFFRMFATNELRFFFDRSQFVVSGTKNLEVRKDQSNDLPK